MVPDTAIFRSRESAIIQPNFHLRKMVLSPSTKTKRKGEEKREEAVKAKEQRRKTERTGKRRGKTGKRWSDIDETKEIESITQ